MEVTIYINLNKREETWLYKQSFYSNFFSIDVDKWRLSVWLTNPILRLIHVIVFDNPLGLEWQLSNFTFLLKKRVERERVFLILWAGQQPELTGHLNKTYHISKGLGLCRVLSDFWRLLTLARVVEERGEGC